MNAQRVGKFDNLIDVLILHRLRDRRWHNLINEFSAVGHMRLGDILLLHTKLRRSRAEPVAYLGGGALGDAPPLAWTQNFFEHIEPKKI